MLRNRTLLAVSFAVFATYVGVGMVVPVRVLYVHEQGASLAIIGAMASAFLVSNFLFQYPVGWVADRWGRKRIMIIGLVSQAVITAAYLLVIDPAVFVVLRFLEGMASATMLSPARALIADNVPTEKQGEAYGIFGAFFSAGFVVGPAIGSLLATLNYESVFIGAVVARLAATVIAGLAIRDAYRRALPAGSEHARRVPSRELFSLPLIGAYILVFGDYLYIGFDQTLFSLWMHDKLGATIGIIGLAYIAFSIPNTLLSPIGGRLADRLRRSRMIFIFGGAQVPIYIMYGLLSSAWPVVALSAIHGAVYALTQPPVDAHLAASSVTDARARVQSIYSSIGLAGAFAGANGLPFLYGLDYHIPLFILGLAFGVCVLVGGLLIRASEARRLIPGPHMGAQPAPKPTQATY